MVRIGKSNKPYVVNLHQTIIPFPSAVSPQRLDPFHTQDKPTTMFHHFQCPISAIPLPEKFTYPFNYTPHPLCVIAAQELKNYLATQSQWAEEIALGKMFGVLIVRNVVGELGYLAAFSGNLEKRNLHSFFVPPVYDLLDPNGFFLIEVENISAINRRIQLLESNETLIICKQELLEAQATSTQEIAVLRAQIKANKALRKKQRGDQSNETVMAQLALESQREKSFLKQTEMRWAQSISALQEQLSEMSIEIDALKLERKVRSSALQLRMFDAFIVLNALGEPKGLPTIFENSSAKIPPAGAAECAGPKLLQYAYLNQLSPVAMAEFWLGESPKGEVRQHGNYYPACKGKCEPILGHMLLGLELDEDPLKEELHQETKLEILFEDEWLLVINKPAGMLSVPGNSDKLSVCDSLLANYPQMEGLMVVHRLDMATSGLIIVAKTKLVYNHLQSQFKNRTIHKRYIALLEGILPNNEGIIELPLCLNPLDRPRQIVNEELGKPAITKYKVLARENGKTRVAFFPLTGRTHQLRVHSAHKLGLHTPISGDELYGTKSERLYLHAEYLEFLHPIKGEQVCVEYLADF